MPSSTAVVRKSTVLSLVLFTASVSALWPLPTNFTNGTTTLKLSPTFTIQADQSIAGGLPADLSSAVNQLTWYALNDNLSPVVPDSGESDRAGVTSATGTVSQLTLSLLGSNTTTTKISTLRAEVDKKLEDKVEGYTLTITAEGVATVQANSTLGLLRGAQTFTQLVYTLPSKVGEADNQRYIPYAPWQIVDTPAFPHRGFMLDTARNFFPIEDIKRTLSAMSWAKLNTFHWHIVDSQSWPLVLPTFPLLSQKGAYSAAKTYSTVDIEDIQAYAAERGIGVFLEVDMPGHTSIIGEAYPEYISCKEATPWATFANEPPAGQLRLGDAEVLSFAENLTSTVASLTTGPYFSTGGDEINAACYNSDPAMNASQANANLNDSVSTFVSGLHQGLRASGKVPVVWEEMVLNYPVKDLGNDTLVLVWISSDDAAAVTALGHKIVHAPSNYMYLDCGHGAWVGNFANGSSWCTFSSWQKIYSFDPYANITAENRDLVMGGQTLLWTEQANPQTLDSYVWPRAAAGAEVFWSGGGGNVSLALPRLHDWTYRAINRGINADALQPEWCARRPGVCDLTA
ncbi:glycoside hydrolase family 20 protein [Meredithblackwellia eburnea MCA 4105]